MRADETTIVKSKVDKISQDIIKMLKIEADENGEVK